MLRVRRDQVLSLQRSLDDPLKAFYVELYGEDAREHLDDDELERRVSIGVDQGRRLGMPVGDALSHFVLLAVFFRPDFHELAPVKELLVQRGMSAEAKMRCLVTNLFFEEDD